MKSKDKVLNAALELFLDNGYHGTSVKLIVEKSGVSTGSVYHHFSNKEDIIKELYAESKKKMNHYLLDNLDYNQNVRTLLWKFWLTRIEFNAKFPIEAQFIKSFFNSPLVSSKQLELVNNMYDEFQVALKTAMANEEIIQVDIVYFIFDLFNACDTVSQYCYSINKLDDPSLTELAFKKYWRSIVKLDL